MLDTLDLPQLPPHTPIDEAMRFIVDKVPMFATQQVTVNGVPFTGFAHQPNDVRALYPMIAAHGDLPFLVYGDTRLSFAETIDRASRLAQALADDFGVGHGDRVAVAMRNYPEWVIAYLAVMAAGGVAVLMNAWWQPEELDWALKDCGARLAIADGERAARMRDSIAPLGLTVIVARDALPDGDAFHALDDAIAGKTGGAWPEVDLAPDDDAMMLYTSGSSGFPKGAVSTHRALVAALMTWIVVGLGFRVLGRVPDDPDMQPGLLMAIPFFHITGLIPVMMASAMGGRKLVLMHKWDVEDAFRMIEAEKLTAVTGVPTMTYELSASDLRHKYDTSSLTDMSAGGAARPAAHVQQMMDAFENISPGIGYGLTETTSLGAAHWGQSYVDRPDTVGRPMPPLMQMKIVDDDGNELPRGEPGEVLAKCITNMRGYWNNDQATADAFTPDGYLRTGDVGFFDADGYLHISDRKKDIVIRGGENISTLEVEGALHALDGVGDVMVFGISDERMGELLGAAVTRDSTGVSADDLRTRLKGHLADFKIPEHIWLVDAPLPRIASGKIDRRGIRDHYRGLYADGDTGA